MKNIAFLTSLKCLPFELDLKNISEALDERMQSDGPDGYLGKVMYVDEGLPWAILFAYEDNSEPDVGEAISLFMSMIAQAVVAFGGWSLWDAIRNECGASELEQHDMPDFYDQLIYNLKLKNK